tara:strand:- start:1222 stop:1668 length:447 start_codon:yes stop_codon:yes gene_type:complete
VKILSEKGSFIKMSRYEIERLMGSTMINLSVQVIPVARNLIKEAMKDKMLDQSAEFMQILSLYLFVKDMREMVCIMAMNLAKEESRYKEALPCLNSNNDALNSVSPGLDLFDLHLAQWQIDIRKFIQIIDPDSYALKLHSMLDEDPPV